ncbi:Mu transposase C-terminal domain-containing protein [Synechocystis sp. PCC 7338]|uniref:Mu transposase C-terminal domain-containing protein n=1 Tax=Synechocystis sp. PCC 7338 TaxID=2732530 RepID=UPI001BAF9AC6|nr:Mu transposase C-terminal domain-containing protein [Synechocystis sp. PCC 7338]QUS60550.1 Mu transposase C-terminal domain-containing protein [Synechocystis sp. PCC 7338]
MEKSAKDNLAIPQELSEEAQVKLEVIQTLLEPCDRWSYGERLKAGAQRLGISVRSVQRLFKRYQEEGIAVLTSNARKDKGQHRISEEWSTFILNTYKKGNEGSRRMTPKQVAVRVQVRAQELGDDKAPSYRTVLRVLEPVINNKKKTIRSPGWQGSTLSVKTRDGFDLDISYSNQVWQCDHTPADVLLVDREGKLLGRPWLTTVIDSYSRCIVGINIGFDAPSSQVVALALRHAVLPKQYGAEYKLHCDWGTLGLPQYLFTDGGKDFCSNHLSEIASQLGFVLKLRHRPSEGGIVERPFGTLNTSLFSTLPGYTGSNVQQRPKEAEEDACLTLRQLEELVVRFIVDRYNQGMDARMGDQSRFQRWEAGLPGAPLVLLERELDICLMKQARRQVQRGGYIQFENINYKGENLEGYAGQTVGLRYDPKDITTIWVYRYDKAEGKEVFLTRAHAQGLETEQLTSDDAKASAKRLREKAKTVNNNAILQEVIEREAATKKPTRKQLQKQEQAYRELEPLAVQEKATAEEQMVVENMLIDASDVEVWDLEQMQEDYGW